jgi:acetyl-CoA decarbonylase/synthase complex subunit gamma
LEVLVMSEKPCCCNAADEPTIPEGAKPRTVHWITGEVATPVGPISQVATTLDSADRMGTLRARLGTGRMHYDLPPGLYAVGNPAADSPVFVSANYKLSFDCLRRALASRDGWILVLDTKGINVWCAAGKGTFGTEELLHRLEATRLGEVVSHRVLILPQLGAPGVAAHEVKQRSGFRVVYGPVRAQDLPAFLDAGRKATPEMRRVAFGLLDRLVLTPIEVVYLPRSFLIVLAAFVLLAGLGRHGYSLGEAASYGGTSALLLVLAFLAGAVVTPLLLPWLPGRAFSTKGATVGLALAIGYACLRLRGPAGGFGVDLPGWLLLLPAVSAFFAMNFTGASTYTSLSGVKAEMRTAVPIQIAGAAAGACFWLVGRFL